jgi:hypothetical protein
MKIIGIKVEVDHVHRMYLLHLASLRALYWELPIMNSVAGKVKTLAEIEEC